MMAVILGAMNIGHQLAKLVRTVTELFGVGWA
jgi:hypothetical protein